MDSEAGDPVLLLDRDGVLNEDRPHYVRTPADWVWVPGTREALARLTAAGVRLGVVTNQACIGKGVVTPATLAAIHGRMVREAAEAGARIEAVFVCPHADNQPCRCRKPGPGLIEQAAVHFGCPSAAMPFVGDARRDLEAAAAAGSPPVLVRTGKGAETEAAGLPAGVAVFDDLPALAEAVRAGEIGAPETP